MEPEVFDYAYPGDDKPILMLIESFAQIAKHVPAIAGESNAVVAGVATHGVPQKSCGAQLLTSTNRYLTASDWAWIRDVRNDMTRKSMRMVVRAVNPGLRHLDGTTKR